MSSFSLQSRSSKQCCILSKWYIPCREVNKQWMPRQQQSLLRLCTQTLRTAQMSSSLMITSAERYQNNGDGFRPLGVCSNLSLWANSFPDYHSCAKAAKKNNMSGDFMLSGVAKASIPMGNFAGLSLCATTAAATHSQPACFLWQPTI